MWTELKLFMTNCYITHISQRNECLGFYFYNKYISSLDVAIPPTDYHMTEMQEYN